jgi:hypothetical protein
MTRGNVVSRFITVAWLAGAIGLFTPLASIAADSAGNTATSDDWQFKAQLYGWLPTIEGTLPTGDDIELTIDEIFDYLDFTFMGVFQARKGNWAVVSDIVYLKLSGDEAGKTTIPLGPLGKF